LWPGAVLFHDAFDSEFVDLSEAVQDELLAQAKLLEQFGPTLGRRALTRSRARGTPT
jgi:hypothetical protein